MDDLTLNDYVKRSKDRVLGSLIEWLKIPSISADPAHARDVAASAEFCAGLMRSAGLEHVELLSASGVPAVYGDWLNAGHTSPTVLVYGHHDVQPVDPLDEWTSPPFVPVVEGDRLLARGASDDKGQVMMQVEATRGLLEALGHLPVNVKFLIEGEEEVGSPHLDELLEKERDRLAADVIIVSDSTMLAPDIPSTTVSTRGLVAFDVTIRTAKSDLHSGIWGGTVPNAALVAARLAAGLHDSDHRVTLPGFYDRVRELSKREAQSLADTPFDELEFCRQAGVSELEGEAGRSPYERTGTRPTAEVVGLHSGYGGPGMKTIVPATANLKVAIRLVPDQSAEEVEASFRAWLAAQAPKYAQVSATTIGGVAPLLTPVDHPAVRILSQAIENVWGRQPLFTRSGGSGPEEALGRILAAPVLFLGIGLPDDSYHAPNERLELNQLWQGILAAGEFLLGVPALKTT
ncbi:MAG TPA: dipeptidase [Acidimicrobiales bacterium]|nr:dipeptidase [Acidimicrobiales bacterium]